MFRDLSGSLRAERSSSMCHGGTHEEFAPVQDVFFTSRSEIQVMFLYVSCCCSEGVSYLISCVAWTQLAWSDHGRLPQVIPGRSPYGSWDPGRCLRCAVVGNSGNLRGAGYGPTIDGHNYIMRWNTRQQVQGGIRYGDIEIDAKRQLERRGEENAQVRRAITSRCIVCANCITSLVLRKKQAADVCFSCYI